MFSWLFKSIFTKKSFFPFSQKKVIIFSQNWYQQWIFWLTSILGMYTFTLFFKISGLTPTLMQKHFVVKFTTLTQTAYKHVRSSLPYYFIQQPYQHINCVSRVPVNILVKKKSERNLNLCISTLKVYGLFFFKI